MTEPAKLDESLRDLVRDTVRQVVREELSALSRRNASGPTIVDEDGYLSVTKAARLADVAPGTIRAWIRAGRLTSKRAGRVLRVSRNELARFMSGTPTGPRGEETERRADQLFRRAGALGALLR